MSISHFNDLGIDDVNACKNYNDNKQINYILEIDNSQANMQVQHVKKAGLINKQRYVGLKRYIWLEPATLRQTTLLMTNT